MTSQEAEIVAAAKALIGNGGCIGRRSSLDPHQDIVEVDIRRWSDLRSAVLAENRPLAKLVQVEWANGDRNAELGSATKHPEIAFVWVDGKLVWP